jgi:hypothetical protein
MRIRIGTLLFLFFLFVLATSSCQKDAAVKDPETDKISFSADSAVVRAGAGAAGDYLAASGILKIKIQDSTFTFDASRDSVAFINVQVGDGNRYFGITAINKEHTMSFGISASGLVYSDINSAIAGSQFLLTRQDDDKRPVVQYSLSKYSGQKNFGNINVIQYRQAGVLAKGTFFTFLATDNEPNAPFYKAEGSFDLQLK